jgi:mitochondrial fission protein ELM1
MKTLACLVLAIGALASPVVSFAQSTAPVTRAQVRAELIRLEQAGYHVGDGDHNTYPAQIQAAEAKIAAEDSQQAANNAAGGTTINGTSAAGSPLPLPMSSPSTCVGTASFCNLYFGN